MTLISKEFIILAKIFISQNIEQDKIALTNEKNHWPINKTKTPFTYTITPFWAQHAGAAWNGVFSARQG